jgi:hypothetical protein
MHRDPVVESFTTDIVSMPVTTNPFWRYTEDQVLGERVRVQTAAGVSEGLATYFNHRESAILLRDAVGPDGEQHDTLMIRRDFELSLPDAEVTHTIETVSVSSIASPPYSVREFDDTDFYEFVRQVREHGGIRKLPTVRPTDCDEVDYEVVSGNKRVAALKAAGVDKHPVEIDDIDAQDAARQFIDVHFPLTADEQMEAQEDNMSGWYSPHQMKKSYQLLCDKSDSEWVDSHPAIQQNKAILAADEDSVGDVAAFLTGRAESATGEEGGEQNTTSGQTIESVATALAKETSVDEETAQEDLETLQGYNVPLSAAKGALRRKYA